MLNIDLDISNIGFVISLLTAVLYATSYIWAYQTKIKNSATMQDVKESEARCMTRIDKTDSEVAKLSDKFDDRHDGLMEKIDQNHKEILKHIINCQKR